MFESNLINLTAIHSNKNQRDRGTSFFFIILKDLLHRLINYINVTKTNSGPLQFS